MLPKSLTWRPVKKLPMRNSGSRGTLSTRWRPDTRAISLKPASGSVRCSHTSTARTRSKVLSANGRPWASPWRNPTWWSRPCQSWRSPASGRSSAVTVASGKRARRRSAISPSPQPTSSTRVIGPSAATPSSSSSSAARKRLVRYWISGLPPPYLLWWLPMTMSGVSGAGVLVLTPQRYATVREDFVGRPFSHATPGTHPDRSPTRPVAYDPSTLAPTVPSETCPSTQSC